MPHRRHNQDPNPHIDLEKMTGADILRPLSWLSSHIIDSIVISESPEIRLVSADHHTEGLNGNVHVTCTTEDGASIILTYDPTDREKPVGYALLTANSPQ